MLNKTTPIDYEKVVAFWQWFKSVSNKLILDMKDADVLSTLDNYVATIGPFDWEIGPDTTSTFYLAISTNLNPDLVGGVRQIVDLAPVCRGWSFLSAKPPKESWEIIEMFNELNAFITVYTSSWEYVLYKFEDGTFDMDIKIDSVDGNVDTCYLAVDIAITSILGEEKYMQLIRNVKIVPGFEADEKDKSSLFKYLSKHILEVA